MGVVGNGMSIMKTGVLAGNIPPPPPIPTAYVSDGLVLYVDAGVQASYPGSGSRWTDTIGGREFTLLGTGTPTYSATNGGSLHFQNFQYAQTNTPLPSLTRWSVEGWVKLDSGNGNNGSIVTDIFFSNNYINFLLGGNSQTYSYAIGAGYLSDGQWRDTPGFTPPANQWCQGMATYDGANLKAYVNGDLKYTLATSDVPGSGNSGIRLMSQYYYANHTVHGYLGLVRIYNIALNQSQVQQNYTANLQR
jgi:hypothetical protein